MKRITFIYLLLQIVTFGYAGVNFGYKPASAKAVLNPITVSGVVVSSAQPLTGLPGVGISLQSTDMYIASTNALGQFSISNVESETTYAYTFIKSGYQTVTGTLTVGNVDVNMGTIALNRVPPPPQEVLAIQSLDQSQVGLIWSSPATVANYKIWRLLSGDEENEADWTLLTPLAIADTTYIDTAWTYLLAGVYKYALKAVHPGDTLSEAAFSNEVSRGVVGLLSGIVRESGSNIPIAGAMIAAGGYRGYSNATGAYSILVYSGTYNVSCHKNEYQPYISSGVVVTENQTTTLNILMLPNIIMPTSVIAQEIHPNVQLSWAVPGYGTSEWIHYDDGTNANSVGTGGASDFEVAIRYPASVLQNYAGMSLYAVKMWPAQPGIFSVRVWRSVNAAAPSLLVADQAIAPVLGTYNTVILSNPVPIIEYQELWFGYRCVVSTGFPAGCDFGPAVDGFGNMLRYQGEWSTLLEFNELLDCNWNIQGYVGFAPPSSAPILSPVSIATAHGTQLRSPSYKVWRLHPGEEDNETIWTSLTPNAISTTSYTDTAWMSLPYAAYKWAVKAAYAADLYSDPAFSNILAFIAPIGTISGVARNHANQPVAGATISCSGISAITNAYGAYNMEIPSGIHAVSASHPYYSTITVSPVNVSSGQITNVNFVFPPFNSDGFESYPDFALSFMPWTLADVDLSSTIGLGNSTWENIHNPMAFMIFNPGATIPPLTNLTAHNGSKMACSFGVENLPANDWLISPPMPWFHRISFWARSASDNGSLARLKVGISNTSTNYHTFNVISGANAIEVPAEWTEYVYFLAQSYVKTYVGIQSRTLGDAVLCIDDFSVTQVANDDPIELPVRTSLWGNYPNPFNPETTISYSLKETSTMKIDIYNAKGQLVKNLENDIKAAGDYDILWDGKDNNGRAVSSGVFYYKMSAGKYSSTRKMIMLK